MINQIKYIQTKIQNDPDLDVLNQMTEYQVSDMISYLNNKLTYQLINLLGEFRCPNSYSKIIGIYQECQNNNLNLYSMLFPMLGGKDDKTKTKNNIIMEGITATLRSILDRKFDKNRIDFNLVEGANERKVIYAKAILMKNPNDAAAQKILNYYTPQVAKNKYVTSAVSANPLTEGKNKVFANKTPIAVSADTTVADYKTGVEVIKNLNPKNPLDAQITQPLDEPPTGKSGATIVTTKVIPQAIPETLAQPIVQTLTQSMSH